MNSINLSITLKIGNKISLQHQFVGPHTSIDNFLHNTDFVFRLKMTSEFNTIVT